MGCGHRTCGGGGKHKERGEGWRERGRIRKRGRVGEERGGGEQERGMDMEKRKRGKVRWRGREKEGGRRMEFLLAHHVAVIKPLAMHVLFLTFTAT